MSQIRVVVVDDHPAVRAGLCAMLSKMPDVLILGEAGDGHDALQLAQTLRPDVLLLDMELPGLKGVEIAQRLRMQHSPVRILGLSAHDDEAYVFGLLEHGASGYMTKDDALTAIGEAVRGVARGEVGWFSRRVMAKVVQRNFGEPSVQPHDRTVLLSLREREVLQLVAQGQTNEQIAQTLQIADGTVKNHVTNIYSKLEVRTRAEAVAWAWRQGIMGDSQA